MKGFVKGLSSFVVSQWFFCVRLFGNPLFGKPLFGKPLCFSPTKPFAVDYTSSILSRLSWLSSRQASLLLCYSSTDGTLGSAPLLFAVAEDSFWFFLASFIHWMFET